MCSARTIARVDLGDYRRWHAHPPHERAACRGGGGDPVPSPRVPISSKSATRLADPRPDEGLASDRRVARDVRGVPVPVRHHLDQGLPRDRGHVHRPPPPDVLRTFPRSFPRCGGASRSRVTGTNCSRTACEHQVPWHSGRCLGRCGRHHGRALGVGVVHASGLPRGAGRPRSRGATGRSPSIHTRSGRRLRSDALLQAPLGRDLCAQGLPARAATVLHAAHRGCRPSLGSWRTCSSRGSFADPSETPWPA